jgi:hypothetical protein
MRLLNMANNRYVVSVAGGMRAECGHPVERAL